MNLKSQVRLNLKSEIVLDWDVRLVLALGFKYEEGWPRCTSELITDISLSPSIQEAIRILSY